MCRGITYLPVYSYHLTLPLVYSSSRDFTHFIIQAISVPTLLLLTTKPPSITFNTWWNWEGCFTCQEVNRFKHMYQGELNKIWT